MKRIRDFHDLVGLENEQYYVKVGEDRYNGWVLSKNDPKFMWYLSTHTFYGSQYQKNTKRFQELGFDIELDNWDQTGR